MNRKSFIKASLATLGSATVLSSCIPDEATQQNIDAPNLQNKTQYHWKMVTTWPPKFPVLGEIAEQYAEWVKIMSGGRINIKVYGGGELVPALEVFDAVASGTSQMGSGCAYYWAGKTPAAQFFAAVPFGMNAQQITSWLLSGGGYELWKEVYADFNVVPFLGGNTGVQMGGWFNKEINSVEDLKGLKMRIPGLGGKVLERAGGAAVLVAGGELYTSLERGIIDATEWIGPFHDYRMGFHKIAKYYYTPGWHEPGTEMEFMINKGVYDSLPSDLQEILMTASLRAHTMVLSEFDAKNGSYLKKIKEETEVEIREFPQEVLDELRVLTEEVVQELISSSPIARKAYESFNNFRKQSDPWMAITEKVYYNRIQKVD